MDPHTIVLPLYLIKMWLALDTLHSNSNNNNNNNNNNK